MKYGAVVVTYNRLDKLKVSLRSFSQQNLLPEKVIVVDNCSTDGTGLFLDKLSKENDLFQVIHLQQNIGGSGGFYEGMKAMLLTDVEWMSLSDDDASFKEDYFSLINEKIKENESVLAFTGTVRYPDQNVQLDQRGRITNWNHIKVTEVNINEYKSDFYVDQLTFCGAFVNSKLVKKIGLPEKDYFIWGDDIEYSVRLRKYTKILNITKAVLIHDSITSTSSILNWKYYYGSRNQIVTALKLGRNKFLVWLWILGYLPKAVLDTILHKDLKGQRLYFVRMKYDSYFDALKHNLGINEKYLPGTSSKNKN